MNTAVAAVLPTKLPPTGVKVQFAVSRSDRSPACVSALLTRRKAGEAHEVSYESSSGWGARDARA